MGLPAVPRYAPTNNSGFLDGFAEKRGEAEVASSDLPFGQGAETLRSDARQKVVRLVAQDTGHARAILYTVARERTAVFLMHPRADVSSHYLVPSLLDAGYAVLTVQSRYFNNDEDCLHEALLADAAAGMHFLRAEGFEHVVLLGNSGGGSLFCFYQSTAQTAPPDRPTHTPGGTPYDLNGLDLPLADGLLLLAAHMGEGQFLMNAIDPSVTDESDPMSCDPGLDMYNPVNGFRRLPEESRYSQQWLASYRTAQRDRVARIDALAREQITANRLYADLASNDWFAELPVQQQIAIERRGATGRYLMIARTDADPASLDLTIKPSQRGVGSLQGPRPDLQNYRPGYFAHCMTPEGWLSTWSGLSSRAALSGTVPGITIPTCLLGYSADNAVLPEDTERIYALSPASDKELHHIDGDHFGVGSKGKAAASQAVLAWLRERYPTR
jgi:hypothetical protein